MIEVPGERSKFAKEFTYTMNRRDPRIEPCGMPDFMGAGEEELPFRMTL